MITKDAESSVIKLLTSLYYVAEDAIEKNLEYPIYDITSIITVIGVNVSDKKLPHIARKAKTSLHDIHKKLLPRCLNVVPENLWIKLCKYILKLEKELDSLIE